MTNKINYVKGDVVKAFLDGEVDVLVHGANCFHTMGSGVAKLIKEKLPEAYKEDLKTKRGDVLKLGTSSYTKAYLRDNSTHKGLVFNVYSQYNYGNDGKRYLEYGSLASGLSCMGTILLLEYLFNGDIDKSIKVGMPKIGAGLAGGDWKLIEQIIESVLCSKDFIEVYVYTL